MADEDEIDILGDFSLGTFSSQNETNLLDGTPLVSQNSDLLNCDYTIHPQWLLDKPSANPDNWYETNSASSTSDMSEADALGHISTENYITDESGWTEKEKNLLQRGIEIFGKSSVRLSQFVGSKTASEVKYYLKNFYSENQNYYQPTTSETHVKVNSGSNLYTEVLDANQIPASIEEVIAVVTTGTPTVSPTINKKFRGRSFSSSKSTSFSARDASPGNRVLKTKPINTKKKVIKIDKPHINKTEKNFKDTTKTFEPKKYQKIVKFKFKANFKVDGKKRGRKSENILKITGQSAERNKSKFDRAELTTGKGLAVPVSAGEEIVKIEHADDDSSDISIDIENVEEIGLTNKPNSPDNRGEFGNKIKSDKTEDCTSDKKFTNNSSTLSTITDADKCMDLSQVNEDIVQQLTSLEEPTSEVTLDVQNVTELEKLVHSEFFEGRTSKTPERYLKIRNHIINSWQSSKPNYITKTSMRLGLKNCGDVTCISRIHYFLEQIGAINYGCEQTKYERPMNNSFQLFNLQKHKPIKPIKNMTSREPTELGPRQRIKKKFNNDGEGGCTLVHGAQGEIIDVTTINEEPAKQRLYIKKPTVRLIYCRPFTEEKPQEYTIKLSLSTLLLMDFHAHTYLTEVMGLVGGSWDLQKKTLTISCYEPCRNIASSTTHCDMCPISQANAAESIHNQNLQILGWFHSHPTFAPEPSQQDLDTQKLVQQWIGHNKPCIGVILTPFSFNGALISSPFRCLMVDKKPNFDDQIVPYRFKVDVIAGDFDISNFLNDMKIILLREDGYLQDKRISFHSPYFQDLTITHLDKFISSVNLHLVKNGELSKTTCELIMQEIQSLINNLCGDG